MAYHEQLSDRERDILELLAAGAADKEIARQLHLSLNTVKWHNRQIYAKLGVENRTQAVAKAVELNLLGEEQPPAKPAFRIPHNLPAPVSSFVGREKEITEIIELLQDHRLVTLTGPGGVGKTRLALEVATSLLADGRYQDGIYFVELAVVRDSARIGEAILDALGLRMEVGQNAQERLRLFLQDKNLLLALDNFEHLLSGAPLVTDLLTTDPSLSVLCTSREALHLSGEQSFLVEPLTIDPSRELFVQRARSVNPNFDPKEDDHQIIDQICARLDRLPLAIELAAAWVNIFNLEGLLEQLSDRFSLLTRAPRDAPARHQTLAAAIDWSYNLLDEEEQVLFRRLAVFQGSRTIDAVQDVCCFDLELSALDGLESLISKNLIKEEEGLDGEARFYLLETIHEFVKGKLIESGEEEIICQQHAEFYVELAERSRSPRLHCIDTIFWHKKLESDFENFRRAHDWVFSHGENELRLRLNYGLMGIWLRMGHLQIGRDWVNSALEILDSAPLSLQAGMFWAASLIEAEHNQYERSLDLCQEALTRFQALENSYCIGKCHLIMIFNLVRVGSSDAERILGHYQIAKRIFSELGSKCGLADAFLSLAHFYDYQGNEKLKCQLIKRALGLYREIGDENDIWDCLINLAVSEVKRGNIEIAKKMYLEVLEGQYTHFRDNYSSEFTLAYMSGAELALGYPRRAVILLSVSTMMKRRKGQFFSTPGHQNTIQNIMDMCKEQLNQNEFETAWEYGKNMSFAEAIAFARAEGETE